MFEYTKEHNIIRILERIYAVDILEFIKNIDDRCYVNIEDCPVFQLIHRDLEKLEIESDINSDAEKYHRHKWRERLPQVKYISYWDLIRPPRIDELEEYTFDFDKWLSK